MSRRPLASGLAAVALAGCGSSESLRDAPAPARAASSPPVAAAPEGRIVPVGREAEGVAVDPQTGLVAVAVRDPARLVLVDATTLRVQRRVRLPGPARHVRLAQRGGPFLVPVEGTRTVVEVPVAGGAATATRLDRRVHDVAAAGALLVAGDGMAAIPDGPVVRILAGDRRLETIDPRTGAVLADAPAGVGPTHVAGGEGGRGYVADTGGGSVLLLAVRSSPPRILRRAALPGAPYGMAVDRAKGKLWVTLTARNEVVQLTADAQPRPQRRYATVRQPNAVAVHEPTGRIFITGRADGVLQAFDGYRQRPGTRLAVP